MTTEKGITVVKETGELQREAQPLMVSPEYVNRATQSIQLLQDLVRNVLVEGRDWGRVPGTTNFLWEPGASMIIAAFNSHVGPRRLLHLTDTEDKISLIIEIPIINNATGREVGSGIAAASTNEVKHKVRWVKNPLEWGYSEDTIQTLRTRTDDNDQLEYRILNPDRSELLNVLTKQASKRAETDAAEALPGVASVLRELFKGKYRGGKTETKETEDTDETSPRWTQFWSASKAMGLEPDEVHKLLAVKSMKDWIKDGRSLDDAIKLLSEKLATRATGDKPTQPAVKADQPGPAPKITPERQHLLDAIETLKKKGWTDAKLAAYFQSKCKDKSITTAEKVPDDKVNQLANELADWALMA